MLFTPLEPKYEIQVNIRPIKTAYFFREDDEESLLRILRLVNTQWGGIRNLIIPFQPSDKITGFFRELLEIHEPEWFVSYLVPNASDDQTPNHSLRQYLQELFPDRSCTVQIGSHFETHERSLHTLGAIPEYILKQHSAMMQPKFPQGSSFPEWMSLALYGAIYPGQEEFYNERIKIYGRDIYTDTEDFWEDQYSKQPFSSILKLTAYGTYAYEASGIDSNHFDVVLINSLNTLCLFWNLRSLRLSTRFQSELDNRTLMLPASLLKDTSTMESLFSFIKKRINQHTHHANIDIIFPVWNTSDRTRMRRLLKSFPFLKEDKSGEFSVQIPFKDFQIDYTSIPSELVYTFFPFFETDRFLEGIQPRVPISTNLSEGRNTILYHPPSSYANNQGGDIALDIQCDVWQRFPQSRLIAEFIRNGSRFSRYGVSSVTTMYAQRTNIEFTIPDEWNVLRLWFKEKGYDIKSTKVSKYSDAVINLVGGRDGIEVIANTQAYLILYEIASKSSKKVAQYIYTELGISKRQLANMESEEVIKKIQRAFEENEIVLELRPKTYLQLKGDSRLKEFRKTLITTLDRLASAQILKRGFYLDCPQCGSPDWYGLSGLKERLVCSGCSHEFPLPVERPSGSELQWQYRLNTLVERAIDQDVLTGILAFYHLTKNRRFSCATFGLELWKEDRSVTDFDFAFISEQQLYAGECKTGTELDTKDLDIADIAASVGVHTFYYCTVQQFSDTTKRLIDEQKDKLIREGSKLNIEVLSGAELLGSV